MYNDFEVGNVDSRHRSNDELRTSLIVAGKEAPKGARTYTTGLRSTEDGQTFCGGSLISPTHVLTASHCAEVEIRWVSIGSHYVNGTLDGEQIRVVARMNHPKYGENATYSNDFLVLELERPSSFKPVKLAAFDDSDIKKGEWATVLGWGRTGDNDTQPYELQTAKVQLWNNDECAKKLSEVDIEATGQVDDTMVCAGGGIEDACYGDSGGPLIKETPGGEYILIGVVSWGAGCSIKEAPTAYARVSTARSWIETFSNSSCFK
ncbi:hypothetical protein PHYBOEH_008623 [Phytophthora boehmeriae]|uniref:Peptidase S1 domain-containing protein n=1 Tax=Phytophthora boehmeriae TaxID=109152 RepID=A0A8T1W3D4_9STRA|nr:hypothetical protein PHYBOEH_008623 [Phytophthora boehmeriae]